jgi:hypothetical protein
VPSEAGMSPRAIALRIARSTLRHCQSVSILVMRGARMTCAGLIVGDAGMITERSRCVVFLGLPDLIGVVFVAKGFAVQSVVRAARRRRASVIDMLRGSPRNKNK